MAARFLGVEEKKSVEIDGEHAVYGLIGVGRPGVEQGWAGQARLMNHVSHMDGCLTMP